YAEQDAEDLATALEASARSLFEDSVLIYRVTSKSNKAPTKQELEKVFADISKKAKSEDVLYIFFAGHGGVPKTQANPNNEVRFMLHKAEKFNPMSTSFGISDIKDWIQPQRIKAQKRVLVFDACHSGQFIKDQMKLAYRGQKDEAWRKKQLDKLKDQTGMMILAASAADQVSYEDPQLKHGVMTYHLLKQIKETQQDTLLILNNWFGKSSEGVKFYIDRKYPRSGNDEDSRVQDPQMFGRGDFGVGMVTQQVRDSIQLNKIKTLIGNIQFTDATNSIYSKEPKFKEILHDQIQQQLDGNRYEFDPKANYEGLGYTIHSGSFVWMNNSSINTYTIRFKGEDIKQVIIPQFTTDDPNVIAQKIAESIIKEIQVLEK
ncbi:MAG: caspase family protein, partial [Bacteroidia bacterium]